MNSLNSLDAALAGLRDGRRLVLFAAMGFEDRTFGFLKNILESDFHGKIIGIKYQRAKATNREVEFRALVSNSSNFSFSLLGYSSDHAFRFEIDFDRALKRQNIQPSDIVVLDISAMSKFLILVCLLRLWAAGITVHVAMTTASAYSPSKADFDNTMEREGKNVRVVAGQPSSGASAILRSSCMVSARMQGQPVCAVAFTSFNEELIRHAVGTLNPHRLLLINGSPPSESNIWRAYATQTIHARIQEENANDNPIDPISGLLVRTVSTLYYDETLRLLREIHSEFGLHERMIYFATGSKMQTVALALLKLESQDVHIEYPTPDSYFFKEYSTGIDQTFMLELPPTL